MRPNEPKGERKNMKMTFRWYGSQSDKITLKQIKQIPGCTGLMGVLDYKAAGEVWEEDEIKAYIDEVHAAGLECEVIESVNVHEDIKLGLPTRDMYIENYCKSIRNLAKYGVKVIVYNFMPVLDWTRTDLEYVLPDGSKALRFDQIEFAAFEMHILKRPGAEADYTEEEIAQAAERFATMSDEDKARLTRNIIAGLPGAEEGYTLDQFRKHLELYKDIDKAKLRENFAVFLKAIIPVAEEVGVRMAVHPDDPPRPILGLPRIVSTIEDMQWMVDTVNSMANGFTMCTGSYGVRADNDLVDMIKQFGPRIYFTHLRSTMREDNPKTFHEAAHLNGDVDMYEVVKAIVEEEHRRKAEGKEDLIPMRPDHGHQMLDDLKKKTNPGYSAIGRLKGLAEVRGVELAIQRAFFSR